MAIPRLWPDPDFLEAFRLYVVNAGLEAGKRHFIKITFTPASAPDINTVYIQEWELGLENSSPAPLTNPPTDPIL